MNQTFDELYYDLVAMKIDLQQHLETKCLSTHVKQLAEEELFDVIETLRKLEEGEYGICEDTGQPLPDDLIKFQPTVRSINEVHQILQYLKKPVIPLFE